jgi:TRAP-type C4-dicarboxylate transport system substrate-binding protein
MRKNGHLMISAILVAGFAAPAEAATVLTIESWISPRHVQNSIVLPTWAKNLEKATQGRVKAKITYPPGVHPKTFFDRARTGIADVTWGFHGYSPGKFKLTRIVELPGLDASAYEASVAYQKIQEKYLAKGNEHRGIKLLAVFSHGPGVLHTKTRITSIRQLKGLKIRVGGGIAGQVSKSLGVVSVPAPATKVYEFLAQGVADGVFMDMYSKLSLKLSEVAPFTMILPGGFYNGSFFIAMNKAKYDRLSRADRAALDRVSGVALAEIAGRAWASGDQNGTKFAKANGNTIELASPELSAAINGRIAFIEKEWIKSVDGTGVDAAKALMELRAEVQRLKGK